ncbi:MAG TPA: tripartite tricarboxylate transporter substrate binding protein [Alphaproteobacteria bacterium]|nr:tripartite tricarboxylate transporter substrate binding protein [Alphaproteobacteria bacterium]
MNAIKRWLRRSAMVLVALLLAAGVARAQAWPERPVRLLVPLGPGSGADVTARLLADRLSQRWHQPVVVENRPGADGIVGITAFLVGANDHTLLFTATGAFTSHPFLYENLPYDQNDLLPVARVTNTVISVSVPASLGVTSLKELMAMVRGQQRSFYWSSVTGATDVVFSGFLKDEGVGMVRVPYRQPGQAVSDLAAGRIDVLVSAVVTVRAQVTSGAVRLLALLNHERAPAVPEVPTAAEAGFPNLAFDGLAGLFTTRLLPIPLRERIAADVRAITDDADIAAKISATGQIVSFGGPDEFAASIAAQRAQFAAIGKALDLKPQPLPAH